MNNWKEYHIKDLGTVITGNTPPTTQREYYGNEYKFIKPTDMIEGQRFVDSTEECLSDLGYQKYKKSLLPKFTPCVVTIGSLGKKMCLTDCECFTNQAVNAVIPNKNNDGIFLYYAFKATVLAYVKQLDSGTSSGRENVSKSSFSNIKITVPPLPTQQKIAGILSKYDEAIENNNKRIKLLEQMAQNLYKEWFVRFRFPGWQNAEFENGIPKGWEYINLFDVVDVTYGYAFASELFCDDKTLNPVVRIRDILDNHTNTFTSESCTDKYIIKENEILIGMDGIFHMCMWNGEKAYQNQRVVKLTSKTDKISNYFVFLAVQPQIKFWEQTIAGTTVAHLGDKHLKRMSILIPSEEILKPATVKFNLLMKQKNFLFKQTQNLSRQRDLLLPRLMSGKLQVLLDTQ